MPPRFLTRGLASISEDGEDRETVQGTGDTGDTGDVLNLRALVRQNGSAEKEVESHTAVFKSTLESET